MQRTMHHENGDRHGFCHRRRLLGAHRRARPRRSGAWLLHSYCSQNGATKNGQECKRALLMNQFLNADRYGFKWVRNGPEMGATSQRHPQEKNCVSLL